MRTKTPADTAWNEDGTELIFRGRGAESRAYRVVHVVRNDGKSDTCPEFTPVYLFDALPRVAAPGHMLHKIATEIAENKNGAAFYFRISNGRMSNSVCVYAVVMRERCVEDGAPMAVVHVAADEESAWAALLQKARGAGSYSGSLLPRAAWEDGERVLHHADADAEVWMAVAELPVGRPFVLRANSVAEDEDGVRRCAAPAWVRAEVE